MELWNPLLISHVVAAAGAVILGGVQLFRSKGVPGHRIVGRMYVVLILWAAITSFWIRDLRDGEFSWLHILSVVTVIGVTFAVVAIRRGDVTNHRVHMTGSWLGATTAMVFALVIPARVIPTYAVQTPSGAALATASIVATSAVLVVIADRWAGRGPRRQARRGPGKPALDQPGVDQALAAPTDSLATASSSARRSARDFSNRAGNCS